MRPVFEHLVEIGCHVRLGRHEQETLAAVWICIGALAYGVMLVWKRADSRLEVR